MYGEQRKCKVCGEDIRRWDRYDKQFCGATCRKRWSRRGDAAKRSLKRIMADLGVIRQTLKEHPDLEPDISKQLRRIKQEVTDVLLTNFDELDDKSEDHKRELVTPQRARELLKQNYQFTDG